MTTTAASWPKNDRVELDPPDFHSETRESSPKLSELLHELQQLVPPLWPLRDYVAVNPFFGLANQRFLEARRLLCGVRNCELLMTREYYRSALKAGELLPEVISRALSQCQAEYPEAFADLSVAEILRELESAEGEPESERVILTVSEHLDKNRGSSWSSHILNDISRYVSAHFDEGQSMWPSPWKSLPLYEAWREVTRRSRRMELMGIDGFHKFVSELPSDVPAAIHALLEMLEVPPGMWRKFLLCQIFSVSGWASYIRYRGWKPGGPESSNADLIGLLAIRLAYDAALARTYKMDWPQNDQDSMLSCSKRVATRYCLQVATEIAYRRKLCADICSNHRPAKNHERKSLQMVFCIDVRSEIYRRNLEATDPGIETFGFAGFFGIPFELIPLGESRGDHQCPVLLNPAFQVPESITGASDIAVNQVRDRKRQLRTVRKLWKSFQGSATSCFSFVESLGLGYGLKLLTDALGITRPTPLSRFDGLPDAEWSLLGPDVGKVNSLSLSADAKITLAEKVLKNLGLTKSFARIVALCGHSSEVVNNPYKAALDCGACGGHSGESNGRLAAAILNDPLVRKGLAVRGIPIPAETWFVAAVHNTTTDEVRFFETEHLSPAIAAEFQTVRFWIDEATRLSRIERGTRMACAVEDEVIRRSRDWAEVRPEWGLAGNAAFIVAPRSRTSGRKFSGRTFLHNYDHHQDPELNVLELIMTAPMVVTSWINLQYYASTVDNQAFGSGNKLIHNVVGQFGIFEGNGGDLKTGLPWQSVHDGERYQHEPLRLLVLIEAPRGSIQKIIEKHAHVRDLVTNGWITLMALDEDRFFSWNADQTWREELAPEKFLDQR